MPMHGVFAEHQPVGDLAVTEAAGDQSQYVDLPRAEHRAAVQLEDEVSKAASLRLGTGIAATAV